MLSSMTGYGRCDFFLGEKGKNREGYSLEVKSLNHRYLDINCRMPERFSPLELKVRDLIKKRFSRGSFNLHINSRGYGEVALRLNIPFARAYLKASEELKRTLGIKGELDVDTLLKFRDVFFPLAMESDIEKDWKEVRRAVDKALGELSGMREKEGGALKKDIEKRLRSVERLSARIERIVPRSLSRYRQRLGREMRALLKEGAGDDAMIAAEVAIYAEKTNVSEEITRLSSHTRQFRSYLGTGEPVGRRLDFLCQEILREANTIASKALDAGITRIVIEAKGELENIREQVQNIE